jgi:hypothetical protein
MSKSRSMTDRMHSHLDGLELRFGLTKVERDIIFQDGIIWYLKDVTENEK